MFYKDMSTDKDQRDASLEVSKKFTDFAISIEMRYDFFQAIQAYKKAAVENNEWNSLDDESKRYVEKMIEDFDRNGMGLPEEEREKIKALKT